MPSIPWKDVLKDIIPVGGILLALVSPLIPFVFTPAIDYSVHPSSNGSSLEIKLNNYGLISAKKVQVSLFSYGVNFQDFISKRSVINNSKSLSSNELKETGSGIFYIFTLPPKSETIIRPVTEKVIGDKSEVITYVRSDSVFGSHNTGYITSGYLIYAAILTIDTIYLIRSGWKPDPVYLGLSNFAAALLIFGLFWGGTCEWDIGCHIFQE